MDQGVRQHAIYGVVKNLAVAYSLNNKEQDCVYKDENIKSVILDIMEYIYNEEQGYGAWVLNEIYANTPKDYGWGNWWYRQIGIPCSLIDTLMLIKDDITQSDVERLGIEGVETPEALIKHFLAPVKKLVPIPTGVGAYRVWTSYVAIGTGILLKDYDMIYKALNKYRIEFEYETSGDGIYEDGSFLQHEGIPYNFGYGINFYTDIIFIADVLNGTVFELANELTARFPRWGIDNYIPYVNDGKVSPLTERRSYSLTRPVYYFAGLLAGGLIDALKYANEEETAEIKSFLKSCDYSDLLNNRVGFYNYYKMKNIINDETVEKSDGNVSKFFNISETGIFDNGDCRMGLRLSSDRIRRYEAIINGNLDGWYTGDGMYYISVDGLNDIDDAWPLAADKYKIPGTTETDAERTAEEFPSSGAYRLLYGYNSFAGGVGFDGIGAAAMQHIAYTHPRHVAVSGSVLDVNSIINTDLQAKKAYFILDDEIVCLGADINHTAPTDNPAEKVYTYVENRKTSEEIYVDGIKQGNGSYTNVNSINLENRLGYFFPNTENIVLTNHSNSYREAAIEHGTNIQGGEYVYYILPNRTAAHIGAQRFFLRFC